MAFIPALLWLLFMLFAKEGTGESMIELGSWLSPKGNHSSWASSSGHFAFGFYPQGNGFAVGIWLVSGSPPEKTIVWTANRDSPPLSHNYTLNLTKTGLWLFQSGRGGQVLISSVDAVVSSASMLDSGNFVLYNDTHHTVVWQSFDEPTDTILGGQNLSSGGKLVSSVSRSDHSSGRYFLIMQFGGNLVAYPKNSPASAGDAYWSSNTWASTFRHLSLNVSGFLCLTGDDVLRCFYNSISPGKKSHNTSSIYRATLEVNGNLRLYEHQFEASGSSHVQELWSTSLETCQIKGVCGFNRYCSNVTGHAVCECFPGFVPSKSSGNLSLDCILAHSKDGCQSSKEPTILYNITQLENVYWDDESNTPYSVVPMKKEECRKSFLEDCDCMAVLYSDGNCNKYRLPLTYGRKVQNASNVAFFKMLSGIVLSPTPNNSKPKPKVAVDNKTSLIMILAFTLGFISLLSLVFAVSIFFTYKRKVYRYSTLSTSENLRFAEDCSLRSFSFDELVKSTRGFTEEIGRGSFGAVYRGITGDSNRSIAVKRLERIVDEGEREFRTEITAIARTHHRNLVKLIGFCINGSRKLLVYEYVSNGSLASLLFNAGQLNKLVKEDEEGVDWMILERMVKVGLWCVQDDPPLRPSIKNVILTLEGLKDIPIPPSPAHLAK
ncbi:putative receptor protein kinase ZmPK1 [Spatholobus suberectus]|nr:putative receptor protein kinase ZmPK1 [Spatholobus suberectus]